MKRERLDKRLVDGGHVASRERARRLVMAGCVRVDGTVVDKPGTAVGLNASVELTEKDSPFVSRGGVKLQGALDHFAVDVGGCVVLDVGASTGGFTDCALKCGATRVFAIDVGYGQFAWSLRNDPRVTLMERTNVRFLDPSDLSPIPEVALIDVSFISLRLVLAPVAEALQRPGTIVALVKPQFEVGKGKVGKGGVVRDPVLWREAVRTVREYGESVGLTCRGEVESPLQGPKGNHEFFLHFLLPAETKEGFPWEP